MLLFVRCNQEVLAVSFIIRSPFNLQLRPSSLFYNLATCKGGGLDLDDGDCHCFFLSYGKKIAVTQLRPILPPIWPVFLSYRTVVFSSTWQCLGRYFLYHMPDYLIPQPTRTESFCSQLSSALLLVCYITQMTLLYSLVGRAFAKTHLIAPAESFGETRGCLNICVSRSIPYLVIFLVVL